MRRQGFIVLLASLMLCMLMTVAAAEPASAASGGKILFVPHDGRPISNRQTADVVRKLGYEVVVPPQAMLGDRDNLGDPEALWSWVEANCQDVQAAVISSDSMIYGSLVGSRKHSYAAADVKARAERFNAFRAAHPTLKLYVFGSIMRTPSCGANAGSEEPDYYMAYGDKIFRYTGLGDKAEMTGLTPAEKAEQAALEKAIPAEYLQDWLGRRVKNYAANKVLIDAAKSGAFDYLILGKDDNAPLSQTHRESRELKAYSEGLPASKFQAMTGIDEMGMLLLTRAVNEMTHNAPLVCVEYNQGVGGKTVPAYSDEAIEKSIRAAIVAAGGVQIGSPQKADFLLAVNTNRDGRTFEANLPENYLQNNASRKAGLTHFVDRVSTYLAEGRPLGIADVAFANGADNALMELLQERGLLFKLRAYAGWNTATNSSGFVLGEGMLAAQMTDDARDQLLLNRYLEDWGYQANVRTVLMQQVYWMRDAGVYAGMGAKQPGIEARAERLLRAFAEKNLPPFAGLDNLQLRFPWSRGFEADIRLGTVQ